MSSGLVAAEDVACVHLVPHIVKYGIVAIGYNGMCLCFELGEVVDHFATKECGAIGQRRFVNDDLSPFGLDALHDALYGRLAKVIGVRLHGESVHTYHAIGGFCAILGVT